MRIVVIGATGHIGTYLIPRLVAAGHEVIGLSRGKREPYNPHHAWSRVERITIDRSFEETAGTFGQRIASLRPNAVIDLICFTLESAQHLVKALEGSDALLVHCGTIWVHGHSTIVPTTESQPREPFGDYGIKKAAIEKWLLSADARKLIRSSILH